MKVTTKNRSPEETQNDVSKSGKIKQRAKNETITKSVQKIRKMKSAIQTYQNDN
jgi:hypothetical protein